MQILVVCLIMVALAAQSAAFLQPALSWYSPRSFQSLGKRGGLSKHCTHGASISESVSMLDRREFAKFSLFSGAAIAPSLLNPHAGQCKTRKSSDGGKWARHYGEFSEEELEGFTESPSGLKYKDVVVGDGAQPAPGQAVQTHYTGYLLEGGNQFDSSYEKNRPLAVKVGGRQVIKGWDEALLSMKIGGRRMLIIPAPLAYGARQVGPIPANSALVFYVELLAIVAP